MKNTSVLVKIRPQFFPRWRALPIFGPLLDDFVQWLHEDQDYTLGTASIYLNLVPKAVRWLQARHIRLLSEVTLQHLKAVYRHFLHRHTPTSGAMRALERFLRVQKALPEGRTPACSPVERELDRYAAYLDETRGLARTTIRGHRVTGRAFLHFLHFDESSSQLYDPSSGRLLIDGRDARDYRLAELRGQMSMVPQEVLLFGGSIAEIIAYGKPGASVEEIEQTSRQANAHEFIQAFPECYATLVGVRDILPKVCDAGWPDFDARRYDLHEIADHQDYSGIVNQLRPLDDRVAAWQRDHSGAEVIADLTGGTKAMSAALAIAAGPAASPTSAATSVPSTAWALSFLARSKSSMPRTPLMHWASSHSTPRLNFFALTPSLPPTPPCSRLSVGSLIPPIKPNSAPWRTSPKPSPARIVSSMRRP